jgi:hypothetical protein
MTHCVARRASSLMEVVLIISVIGALLTLSSQVLLRAGQVHATAVKVVTERRAIAALSARIRADAGHAVQVEPSESHTLLFQMDNGRRVRYTINKDSAVVRELLSNEKVIGYDLYRLSSPFTFTTRVDSPTSNEGSCTLLSVTFARREDDSNAVQTAAIEIITRVGSSRPPVLDDGQASNDERKS